MQRYIFKIERAYQRKQKQEEEGGERDRENREGKGES